MDDGPVSGPRISEARISEYWGWFAVALYLLVVLDMVTTLVAAAAVGPQGEINPLVRWALGQGVATLVAVNLVALVLAAGLFYALLELLRETPRRYQPQFALAIEVFLGVLLSVGLGVLANNLSVVLFGSSLLPV